MYPFIIGFSLGVIMGILVAFDLYDKRIKKMKEQLSGARHKMEIMTQSYILPYLQAQPTRTSKPAPKGRGAKKPTTQWNRR